MSNLNFEQLREVTGGTPTNIVAQFPVKDTWLAQCISENGKALPIVTNALVALRRDPAIRDAFAFDEMQRTPMLMHPIGEALAPFEWRAVTDDDITILTEWMQKAGLKRIAKEVVRDAANARARENSFHPIREYLEGLTWDGRQRVNVWLTTRLGAQPTPYACAVGKMFLVAMVARIFEPGCKADYMPVFEGPQGAMKSSACAVLGGEWFSDAMPDVKTGKELAQHLRGKWLLEVGEMHAMSRADSAQLKAFITRQVERYRPPHGRFEVIEPRQCIFIGTTNKTTYLADETGGRRFWPVKIGDIDIDGLIEDRDQLFAEAVHLYRLGEQWWPDRAFEQQHIKPEQAARYGADTWEENVGIYLTTATKVTVGQVAKEALFFDAVAKVGKHDQVRIAAAMERLGWRRERTDGKTDWKGQRWWVKA
jgi:predicted P-loop ATPase